MYVTRDALIAWGKEFGRTVRTPTVVALSGELGAGKTTLAQAICEGFGVTDPVTSPTFTLVQEYEAGSPHAGSRAYHLDLFRLDTARIPIDDLLAPLDWDAIMASQALVLVEWPERAGDRLPAGHATLRLELVPHRPDLREMIVG
jgi:tRNA threonylcarbamoyladenosine biosynthesis protein TsaE